MQSTKTAPVKLSQGASGDKRAALWAALVVGDLQAART